MIALLILITLTTCISALPNNLSAEDQMYALAIPQNGDTPVKSVDCTNTTKSTLHTFEW